MKTRRTRTLEAAFCATTYRVLTQAGDFDLAIGQPNARWSAFLSASCYDEWGIVTAWNPRARQISVDENERLGAALNADLIQTRRAFCPTRHLAENGDWPDEYGCCVFNAGEAVLWSLARRYAQRAFVTGKGNDAPRLVWIDE